MALRIENDDDFVNINIPGVQVGGYTDLELHSGMTFFLFDRPNTSGIFVSGGSPATHETDGLRSTHRMDYSIDALIFTGRSAFGFNTIPFLMEWLRKNKRGVVLRNTVVPIVSGAAIFDFIDNDFIPGYEWVEKSIKNLGKRIPIGPFWAGTGATVGKYDPRRERKVSGQGYVEIKKDDIYVGVFVVLNSVGDIFDFDGRNISHPDGKNLEETIRTFPLHLFSESDRKFNTTIGAVITNAELKNIDAQYVAYQANLGFASRILPYSTSYDGDTVFCVSMNKIKENVEVIANMARASAELAVLSIFKNNY